MRPQRRRAALNRTVIRARGKNPRRTLGARESASGVVRIQDNAMESFTRVFKGSEAIAQLPDLTRSEHAETWVSTLRKYTSYYISI